MDILILKVPRKIVADDSVIFLACMADDSHEMSSLLQTIYLSIFAWFAAIFQ